MMSGVKEHRLFVPPKRTPILLAYRTSSLENNDAVVQPEIANY